jgi:GDP-D-mannose 3', 5'-epimerase
MQKRAFLHVSDVVSAIVFALQKGFGHGVIQVGPSTANSIKEIAEIVVDISGKDIEISYDWSRPEGDKARCADFSKAKRVLGWQPTVDLRAGLTELYSWMESRLNSSRGNPHEFRPAV